jgi:hypothetical protein
MLNCKTNVIPILMHKMHVSTNKVSLVVLRPKKVENPKKEMVTTVKELTKTQNTVP